MSISEFSLSEKKKDIKDEYRPRESHLAFLSEMHALGANLPEDDLGVLIDYGVLPPKVLAERLREDQKAATQTAEELDRYVLSRTEYMERCKAAFGPLYEDTDIEQEHWKPERPAVFDDRFKRFINSHFRRFCDLSAYEEFYAYMLQADRWLSEPEPKVANMDRYERKSHYRKEYKRIKQNTLYALDRYAWAKDSGSELGEMKYIANLAHAFILFLFDSGRSVFAGKGRQMAMTTTLAAAAVVRMNVRPNTHVKLIACDFDTTQEIFEDKIKYVFTRFPKWFKTRVINKANKLFRVQFSREKGKTEDDGLTSKVSIVAPKITAINGGAPDIVLVDEAAFLDIFDAMVKEARPTIWVPVNGVLQQRRQVWAWSTGGRSEKGNGSYEREHRDLFAKWVAGDYSTGIVPVFLDWTCRPGASVEWYINERKAYATKITDGHSDASIEEKMLQFRQHYPSSIDDMYTVGKATIVSQSVIIKNVDKCDRLRHDLRPKPGRFELVYDMGNKLPVDSFLKYKPIGVQWVPLPEDDYNAPAWMFMPPQKGWTWRYYQGTDPVVHDEGLSKHASVVYDAHFRAPVCLVNWRSRDPYEAYVQSIAMGMYYANHGQTFCPELVESNIGKLYVKYKSGHEWSGAQSLLTQYMLPDYLQGGNEAIGIDTKAARKYEVVRIGTNYTNAHGQNNYFPQYWSQVRFFNPTTTKTGKTTWSVDDRRKHQDDILDATWFAYICRMSYHLRMPTKVDDQAELARSAKPRFERRIVDYSTGRTALVPVKPSRR